MRLLLRWIEGQGRILGPRQPDTVALARGIRAGSLRALLAYEHLLSVVRADEALDGRPDHHRGDHRRRHLSALQVDVDLLGADGEDAAVPPDEVRVADEVGDE